MKVFLSYKSEEVEIAERLQNALDERGHDVWRDQSHIKPGEVWMKAINDALLSSDRIIVLFSARAFNSDVVHNEFMHGLRSRNVIGILTDNIVHVPAPYNKAPMISIYNWLVWDITSDIDHLAASLSISDKKFKLLYPTNDAFNRDSLSSSE